MGNPRQQPWLAFLLQSHTLPWDWCSPLWVTDFKWERTELMENASFGLGIPRAEECRREQDTFAYDIEEDHWESL